MRIAKNEPRGARHRRATACGDAKKNDEVKKNKKEHKAKKSNQKTIHQTSRLITIKTAGGNSMAFRIIYNRNECIGAGVCASISKDLWSMDGEGRATLKGATERSSGVFVLELDDIKRKLEDSVCGSCPAGCIKVEKV
jgi:ferredoxin